MTDISMSTLFCHFGWPLHLMSLLSAWQWWLPFSGSEAALFYARLDDWLFVATSPELRIKHIEYACTIFDNLELMVNQDKSYLVPTQVI